MEKGIKRPKRVVVGEITYIRVYIGDEKKFLEERENVFTLIKRKDKSKSLQRGSLGEYVREKLSLITN